MSKHTLKELLQLMACLRDPQYGCPWDRKQTLASIVPHTLDEVYEVIDTIERQDSEHLKDELGDLLFQVVFYAQICTDKGDFDFAEIIDNLVAKLLRRHPHVFPDGTLSSFGSTVKLSEAEIKASWERIKAEERSSKAAAERTNASRLDDISTAMPSLLRAQKLQKRAASVGFDWSSPEPVLANLLDEIEELREAIIEGDEEAVAEELGDLLFSCVNLNRHLRQDSEQLLRRANAKFEQRFRRVEQLAVAAGVDIAACDETLLDQFWQQAKADLRSP